MPTSKSAPDATEPTGSSTAAPRVEPRKVEEAIRPLARLLSSSPHEVPSGMDGSAMLLVHTMPALHGGETDATTLLFAPSRPPPPGGWPVVAWAHGTTTPGQKTCAPSLSEELDGGLTRDGFESRYAYLIGQLLDADFAVVAPDFEGLGPAAAVPYPYYDEASLARSILAGVQAAREADPALSDRYATLGHSDGGHAVLGVEARAGEAAELSLLGTVAIAPYTSVADIVEAKRRVADEADEPSVGTDARVQAEFNVALMAVGLQVAKPDLDISDVIGPTLTRLLPRFRELCSVAALGVIDDAVRTGGGVFGSTPSDWADRPAMASFLSRNDPAVRKDFSMSLPTLIAQGDADLSVPAAMTERFVKTMKDRNAPVDYRCYVGADHFTIIPRAMDDILAFLRKLFQSEGAR